MTPEPSTARANYAEGPALRRLEAGMLAAGLAGFGQLYITQAVLPSIGSTFGFTATTASLTVSFATGALALTIAPISGLAESYGCLKLSPATLMGPPRPVFFHLGSSVLGAAVGIAYLAAGWAATAVTIAVLALAALLLAGGMDAGPPTTAIRCTGSSANSQ